MDAENASNAENRKVLTLNYSIFDLKYYSAYYLHFENP